MSMERLYNEANRCRAASFNVVHLVYRHCGPVAQLGERLVRNEEASGSIPLRSTMFSITCIPAKPHLRNVT